MVHVIRSVIPLLDTTGGEKRHPLGVVAPNKVDSIRQGAAEALTCIVESLGVQVVPYAVLFMVPLLGRMSDQNQAVRLVCSATFATLVQLLPLDPGAIADPPELVYVIHIIYTSVRMIYLRYFFKNLFFFLRITLLCT